MIRRSGGRDTPTTAFARDDQTMTTTLPTSELPTPTPADRTTGGRVVVGMDDDPVSVDSAQAERAAAGEPLVSVSIEVLEGDAATTPTYAARDAALLVLGTRHHNRLLGSVSQVCVNRPPCAVVVVPPASSR